MSELPKSDVSELVMAELVFSKLGHFLQRTELLLDKLEAHWLPAEPSTDWQALAWRWHWQQGRGQLRAIPHPHTIAVADLCNVEVQKAEVLRNTAQFVAGFPANNVLLTGARGTGKSSLVKAMLHAFSAQGLRMVEVDKQDLLHLPEIIALLAERPEKFIIFCDDLSFEANEPGYKALKAMLDGSLSTLTDNVLVYATSNRRHLMPDFMQDNLQTRYLGEEIHPADSTEEKISLSERFGLWLSFYAFDQEAYLQVAARWLQQLGMGEMDASMQHEALLFSRMRGARSGRVAWQFARDYAGKKLLARQRGQA